MPDSGSAKPSEPPRPGWPKEPGARVVGLWEQEATRAVAGEVFYGSQGGQLLIRPGIGQVLGVR